MRGGAFLGVDMVNTSSLYCDSQCSQFICPSNHAKYVVYNIFIKERIYLYIQLCYFVLGQRCFPSDIQKAPCPFALSPHCLQRFPGLCDRLNLYKSLAHIHYILSWLPLNIAILSLSDIAICHTMFSRTKHAVDSQ